MGRLRLPTNDEARRTLIENVIGKTAQDGTENIKYVLDATITEITALISKYNAAFFDVEAKLSGRIMETGQQTKAYNKLRTCAIDMIHGVKRRIFRNEEPISLLSNYSMTQDGAIPRPASREEVKTILESLIKGDAEAVRLGFPPMVNPSAAELQIVLDVALKEYRDVTGSDTAYDKAAEILAKHRVTANEWIKEIVDELNFALRKENASSKRRIMRSYGFKFESNGTSENPLAQPENFAYQWQSPNLTLSWDGVDNATGYLLQFSTDEENWTMLYEGLDSSYLFQPPAINRFYRIRAFNDADDGVWSNIIQFDPPANQNDTV